MGDEGQIGEEILEEEWDKENYDQKTLCEMFSKNYNNNNIILHVFEWMNNK